MSIKEGGNAGCEHCRIVADLQFALNAHCRTHCSLLHTAAHNAHCCTQRAQHTTRTSRSHNNQRAPPRKQCIFQQIQPTGSLNALGRTNQIGGFCETIAYLVVCRHCSGLARWEWELPHTPTGSSPNEATCTKEEIIRADSHALHHQLHQIPKLPSTTK